MEPLHKLLVVWGPPVANIATAFAVVVALTFGVLTIRTALKAKRMDILLDCNKRYADLTRERYDLEQAAGGIFKWLSGGNKGHEISWCHRFYSLQFDQYTLWMAGFIDTEIMAFWLLCRKSEFNTARKQTKGFERRLFVENWKGISRNWSENGRDAFVELIAEISAVELSPYVSSNSRNKQMTQLLERHKKKHSSGGWFGVGDRK